MPTFTLEILTAAECAELEVEATTPEEAIRCARRMADDEPWELEFEPYDELCPVDEIRVKDSKGQEVAEWTRPECRVRLAAPELLRAAKLVVSRWETGDLAGAVRELAAAVDEADGQP